MSQATIPLRALTEEAREKDPELFERVKGNSRAIAVAKLRELADKLEACELDGVHVAYRHNHGDDAVMRTFTLLHVIEGQRDGFAKMRTTTVEEI